ncbi:TetR/AcrR family transcriptional regulator [Nocardia mangyaensis]|uniref:TetR/AcrR family transcriptional regulator n=1 Tax=Nocardia mangyaensis TaxID=2213200 RepID=UPI0026758077|nr:TetR/AcrR family transcriptional regulator [Nocardia mangyaensis]MDO3645767.1 TetR/AcrR family transcriptional regulator [Nocardia mangyaensis]
MSPKRVDKAARRQEILAAAVRVFARKGFAAARIDDVAAEAGIAKGSVYLYFDSRDALLEAAFDAHAARVADTLAGADDSAEPLDQLATLIRATVTMLAEDADLARIQLDLWSTPLDIAGVYRDYRARIGALLREAELRPGLDPDRTATVIIGAIEGCLVQWLLDPQISLLELADPIVEVCVEGLR